MRRRTRETVHGQAQRVRFGNIILWFKTIPELSRHLKKLVGILVILTMPILQLLDKNVSKSNGRLQNNRDIGYLFYKLSISVILKKQKPSYNKLYNDIGIIDLFSKILGMVIFFLVFGFLIKWKLIWIPSFRREWGATCAQKHPVTSQPLRYSSLSAQPFEVSHLAIKRSFSGMTWIWA